MRTNLPGKVFLAPMAGLTDFPMRQTVYEFGAQDVVFISEMMAVNALSRKNPRTYRMADVRAEKYPVIVQLEGREPDLFVQAAQFAADLGAAGIDLNMGCPVRKVVSSGAGAALMKEPLLASKIIESVVSAVKLPVSVKFRKGWDNATSDTAAFARMCAESGARFITIHGRTKAQGYAGKADWQCIRDAKSAVQIPVVGNGDVTDAFSARQMFEKTGADAVMVGRAALGAPWVLGQIAASLKGKTFQLPTAQQIKQILLYHIDLLRRFYGDALALPLSRKFVCWYSKNFRDAKRFREDYMKLDTFEKALAKIEIFFEETLR